MRELTQAGDLGEIYYYDSVRINLGLFQHDVNVLWDLAVHDLSIMDFVLGQSPVAVSATGLAHVPGQPENIAYMTMFFDGQLIAHVHVNWLAPVKVRRTLLGGSRRMIVFDDLEASEKIKVYDRGISVNPSQENVYQMLVGYRAGDMWAPQFGITEALHTEATHFVDCIAQKQCRAPTDTPPSSLCACSRPRRPMAQQGRPVSVTASTYVIYVKKWPAAAHMSLFALAAAFRFLALKNGFVNDHFCTSAAASDAVGEWPTRD
jgi:predicted dehydrogenase